MGVCCNLVVQLPPYHKALACFGRETPILTVSAGCDIGPDSSPGGGCTGDTVQEAFPFSITPATSTVTVNLSTRLMLVNTTTNLLLRMSQYPPPEKVCAMTVTPQVVYGNELRPEVWYAPTPAPDTRTPPTPAPPTPIPPTWAPIPLCPKYESEGSFTVPLTSCGSATCRKTIFWRLNDAEWACDPCEAGSLHFALAVTKGPGGDDYTFIVGAEPGLTSLRLHATCGQCTPMQGRAFEIPCPTRPPAPATPAPATPAGVPPASDGASPAGAGRVALIGVGAGVAVVLLGLSALFYSRQKARTNGRPGRGQTSYVQHHTETLLDDGYQQEGDAMELPDLPPPPMPLCE